LVWIAAYVVLAGADFGSPFWILTARGARAGQIRKQTHNSMAPVWEANHVWLIFVLVVCWTAYPEVFASVFSTLWIPLILACLGIIMRAVGYVVGDYAKRSWVTWLATVASFVTPFMFGAVIGAVVSGRVPIGNAQGNIITAWLNPTSITIGFVAVTLCAYLAAVYLAADADREGQSDLSGAFRVRGLVAGLVTGLAAAAGVLVLKADSGLIYQGLTEGLGLVDLAVSAGAGLLTIGLLWAKKFAAARFTAAAAVVTIIAGWGIAQSPYILPPSLTVQAAAAADNVLIALLFSIAVGLLILVPSLLLLYGLVLQGRFDPAEGGVVDRSVSVGGPDADELKPLGPPRRRSVITTIIVAATGAALSLSFDGGFGLYLGIAMVLGALATGCILLAFSLTSGLESAGEG
ncbi:MAG: cytochrome d ubiquinol oxidase subunit II, partial [Solirubrobacterales bacterium]